MSWFSNATIYRASMKITGEQMAEKLAPFAFQPCGDLEIQSLGFVPPVAGHGLVFGLDGGQLFASLCVEKKSLPKQVVDRKTQERRDISSRDLGYMPGRKQTREIREQVIDELLPNAFSTRANFRIWIDTVHNWLVIDTSSHSRAHDVFRMLNRALGDAFEVTPLRTNRASRPAMTGWLANDDDIADIFTIDQDATLQSTDPGKPTIKYKNCYLDDSDVQLHIGRGKECVQLALIWNDRISFVLAEGLILKKITALDILKQESIDSDGDFVTGDLMLMTGELNKLFNDLVDTLGGEVPREADE